MRTQRLAVHWFVGGLLIAFAYWGLPFLTARSAAKRQSTAVRADSSAAFRAADSVRRARGDTVTAYVFTPPDPFGYERARAVREARTRRVAIIVILASLAGNTVVWAWQRRRRSAPVAA